MDTTNRCSTCRWWVVDSRHPRMQPSGQLRACESPKIVRGYHLTATDIDLDGAWVEDDEGWAIRTGPDFGCVQWEAKLSGEE